MKQKSTEETRRKRKAAIPESTYQFPNIGNLFSSVFVRFKPFFFLTYVFEYILHANSFILALIFVKESNFSLSYCSPLLSLKKNQSIVTVQSTSVQLAEWCG